MPGESKEHAAKAHEALDRLLADVLRPGVTGTVSLVLAIKNGGLSETRHVKDVKDS